VTPVSGQEPTTDVDTAPLLWSSRRSPLRVIPSDQAETARRALAAPHPVDDVGESQLASGSYQELEITLDLKNKIFWCYFAPHRVPNFTQVILSDLAEIQRSIKRMFEHDGAKLDPPIRHIVVGSRFPRIFHMGGDLAFFADRIRARDRSSLENYAHACIEIVYSNATALDLPIVTVALVQGDALGGGFEAALSCDVIIAEKSAKFGLPEVLFNLFPGMGAYSLLSRKLDAARAERMILSGRIYGAAELHEMGLVDVVAEDGQGEGAVRQYIARSARHHGAHRAVCEVRRRLNPLTFEELEDVTEIWVDAALRLEETDLRKMERLMLAQHHRVTAPFNGAAQQAV
jgi:DSF synthase